MQCPACEGKGYRASPIGVRTYCHICNGTGNKSTEEGFQSRGSSTTLDHAQYLKVTVQIAIITDLVKGLSITDIERLIRMLIVEITPDQQMEQERLQKELIARKLLELRRVITENK